MDWRLYVIWISCMAIGIAGGATLALCGLVGFILGVAFEVNAWERAAKRGMFEIGRVVYKSVPIETK